MPTNRRNFLQTSVKGAALALGSSSLLSACASRAATASGVTVSEPELNLGLHQKFTSPVKISAVHIVRAKGELFVRVMSADGAMGITQANQRMENLYSLLNGMIVLFFVGKDARDLEFLVDEVYRVNSHYKYAGMPFWNCVGHVEIAIWDMLGQIARQPVHALLGRQVLTEIPVYLSSLTRETTPRQEAEELAAALARTGAKAIKIKIGGRMKNTPEDEQRTQALLPQLRQTLGDGVTIYADSNSSYTAEEGIRIGLFLEDHGVAIFEEPCSWEDYEGNRRVTAALTKTKVAGGEQDSSTLRFQDIIQRRVYDVVQPDLYYNGGLIRTMRVAQMAAQAGLGAAPHSPKADPMEAPFLHLASVIPNLEGFQEYPARPGKFESWYEPNILIKDGHLTVPSGPGLGISYDPALWVQAKKV